MTTLTEACSVRRGRGRRIDAEIELRGASPRRDVVSTSVEHRHRKLPPPPVQVRFEHSRTAAEKAAKDRDEVVSRDALQLIGVFDRKETPFEAVPTVNDDLDVDHLIGPTELPESWISKSIVRE